MVVANRTRRLREEVEDNVRERTPINPDEMLELRAVNDVSTAQLARLPALLAKRGAGATANILGAARLIINQPRARARGFSFSV